jgi:penicillin-binding protein 1A
MTVKKKGSIKHVSISGWIRLMWFVALAVLAGMVIFFVALSYSDLPDFQQLENPEFEKASRIYDNQRKEFGRYYTQNRVPVRYDELNPHLIKALISTEDKRFYSHSGIDIRALGRVVYGVVTFNSNKGGGSTISQQLAKLLFERPDMSGKGKIGQFSTLVLTKFKEWITAVKIEKSYTKEEILAMYLNKFNFIYGAYGISAASEIYFGKNQDELSIEEAATMIGMLKNPSLFNPIRRPDTVVARRMVVLHQMMKNGIITTGEYDSLKVLPLDVSNFKRQSHTAGPAPYFRMELAKWLRRLLDKPEYRKPDGSKYNIYRDGLKIYTTIDLEMQNIAEEEMFKHMARIQDIYWKVWRKRDPWKYDADPNQRRIRKIGLESLVRNSERYKSMRERYLAKSLDQIKIELDYLPTDWDIRNMLREETRKGHITKLIKNETISAERARHYRDILKSSLWPVLKEQYNLFIEKQEEAFDTPVKMKVFAYNAKGEEEVEMTPLDSIKYHRQFLQTGILAIDPRTGQIKTWIGGINHKYFQYDHIHSSRQVGSTFKPFIYATAIALQGFSPCFPVIDQPYTIGPGDGRFGLLEPWTPSNADDKYTRERLTLYDCLRQSRNTCSVFLMQQLGNANVVRGLINNMGIDSSTRRSDGEFRVPNQPSICLGSADLSVMEMAGAYCTFANNGLYNKPFFVLKIEDENGAEIYRGFQQEQLALPPKANYVMVDMLRYAGTNLAGIRAEVGGKTGTTNNYVDGWFMGITPSLVVGTWVGGEDQWIRFLTLTNGQGSVMAKPFFRNFIKRIQDAEDVDYESEATFLIPRGGLDIEIDCEKYEQLQRQQNNIEEFEEHEIFEDDFNR